jgi:hypothetical protein
VVNVSILVSRAVAACLAALATVCIAVLVMEQQYVRVAESGAYHCNHSFSLKDTHMPIITSAL